MPIVEIIDEVKQKLAKHNTLIVNAPPGAGKSTILPLALLDEPWLAHQSILLLEPRRLAAKTIATRTADLIGEKVGNKIGYSIRFDTRKSENTKLQILTEGILTRMLHSDNSLEGVGMVIFDEFHERSIHADVALALCREAQQILRPDLRIIIMSATLDMPKLSELLQAPVVKSEGRLFPVDIIYGNKQDLSLIPELAARTVSHAIKNKEGDVLVFLPGQSEILKCADLLSKTLPDFSIHPLYGMLPTHKQLSAILPHKQGKRKIVLATSIAETSLTIEGVKIVVDTGFTRSSRFDPKSGLSRLETEVITKDAADQRAGRAGRLSPGICYRMWTLADNQRLQAHRTPEILTTDLASLVLDMAHWGITDISSLTWLSPPPESVLDQAKDMLMQLQAIENGKLTEHGRAIHRLPCHPRIAHMLLMAEADDLLGLATDIAPFLEERDPLGNQAGIDINVRIEALRRFRINKGQGKKLGNIERIAASYRKLFDIEADDETFDHFETGILLAHAFPERIACARPGNNAQFQLANGKYALAGHKDDLAHEPWLAIAHIDARDGMGKIFMASPINPRDLAPLVKEKEMITWNTKKGGLIASKDLRIGNIVLQSKPLPQPDESHLVEAICEALKKEGKSLLNFNDELTQWQHRILSLRKWEPTAGWPDVSTTTLLLHPYSWLGDHLLNIKKPEDLSKIDLLNILKLQLDWKDQQDLEKLAPAKLKVPSGSSIKLTYQDNGLPPILAVRLQEVFGLADTPTINNGKIKVVMHLLSPGFKPVQITSDLKSFWNTTYFEVKKDMKGRYPKHVWPDDPWHEPAIKGVKKKY